MYPISLYLGFASSIIWVEQVQILTFFFSSVLSYLLSVNSILPYGGFIRVHILLMLRVVMQEIITYMKEQLSATSMENSGECLLVAR